MNEQQLSTRKVKFSQMIQAPAYKKLINETIGDNKRATRFVSAISSAVAVNPALQECEAKTILTGALLGESLNLSPSPQLGQYYLVPFKDKKAGVTNAQFILGYKGYIQLAIRSGYYKKINVSEIKDGELINYNPFDEEIELCPIQDMDERENTPTIGYYAMFEYSNGFKKVVYWSKKQMLAHADKYSPAFSANATSGKYPKVSFEDYEAGRYNKKDEWLYSSFWYKDFDSMAKKTLLRHLISKWGIMSLELQTAINSDNGVIDKQGSEFTATEIETGEIEETEQLEQPETITVDEGTGEVININDI